MKTSTGAAQIVQRERLREHLLKLPGVSVGRRFGGEAFFFRKRFFCHFHPVKDHFFLETFVWNKVDEVVKHVAGAVPHPEYGGYGWVRLPIVSERDLAAGFRLVEITYRIIRTTKRVSIRKDKFSPESLEALRNQMKKLSFHVKEAEKRMQVRIEVLNVKDLDEADVLLKKSADTLKA